MLAEGFFMSVDVLIHRFAWEFPNNQFFRCYIVQIVYVSNNYLNCTEARRNLFGYLFMCNFIIALNSRLPSNFMRQSIA